MVEPQGKWWSHKCWTSSSLPHAAPNEASGDLTNAEQPPLPLPPHGGTTPLPLTLFLLTVGPPLSLSLLTVGPTEKGYEKKKKWLLDRESFGISRLKQQQTFCNPQKRVSYENV